MNFCSILQNKLGIPWQCQIKNSQNTAKTIEKTPWRHLAAIEARRDALLDRCFPLVAPGKGLGASVSKLSGSIYSSLPWRNCSAILRRFVFSTKGNLQWLLFVKWWCPRTTLLTVMVPPFVDQPFAYSWPFQYRKYDGRSLHVVFGLLLLILLEISLILG